MRHTCIYAFLNSFYIFRKQLPLSHRDCSDHSNYINNTNLAPYLLDKTRETLPASLNTNPLYRHRCQDISSWTCSGRLRKGIPASSCPDCSRALLCNLKTTIASVSHLYLSICITQFTDKYLNSKCAPFALDYPCMGHFINGVSGV